ncbi:MAG: transcription initiation factor IIB [Thaumarchaeota archaeon]|nr:MAG: transcription initiation factor IIB [Nitrososphaerota archaeon]
MKELRSNAVALVTDPDTGEIIRKDTGEVISDSALSQDKEWRSFTSEEDVARARTGAPTSLAFHDMGLSTMIGRGSTDASGARIDPSVQMRMGRLRKWNSRSSSHSPTARNLQQAFTILSKLKDRLGLPDYVTEKAAYVYRKAQERGLVRGDTISSVLAASIYVAVRESGVLRTLEDISESSNVKSKEAYRSYRRIVSEFEFKVPMIDPAKYIIRVANNLNFDEKAKRKALDILEQARKKNILAGKDPTGMAASILYIVNLEGQNVPKTQAEIAKAAGVTEVTVRNRSKELRKMLGIRRVTSGRTTYSKR